MNYIAHERVTPLPVPQNNIHHTGAAPVKHVARTVGPVAGAAAKGKPNRKQARRLEVRLADWSRMTNTQGYARPGSFQ